MSWQSQDWVQDDSNFYGYPTPRLSDIVYEFNVNDIYCTFKVENNVFYGYPHPVFGVAPEFDVEKIYHYFQMSNGFYGYPAALGITYVPLGAFMGCSSISEITCPESVYEFGTHTFYETSIDEITISPDSKYDVTTFPADCTILYYQCTTNISTVLSGVEFTLNSNPYDTVKQYSLSITVNNKVTRTLKNYTVDADTSTVTGAKTGYIKAKTSGITLGSFVYSVISE